MVTSSHSATEPQSGSAISPTTRRRVVITGGAAGIGAAIVRRAQAGDGVVGVLDIAPAPEADVSVIADIGDPDAVAAAVDKAASELGGIDVLVNNAGVAPPGLIEELSLDVWQNTMRVNLDGLFLTTKAALPHLRESTSSPTVVNMASIAGKSHSRTSSVAYATTKGGSIAFTRQLARELAPEGIRVNCICPGLVDTDILSRNLDPARIEALVSGIPMGRLATPAEVAALVWFAASEEASYLTGSALDVNGGLG